MRRIRATEGGVVEVGTGKMIFPSPPAVGVLDPTYVNMIQEEICAVIEGRGFAIDETKRNQLLEAIDWGNRITVAKTIAINPAGTNDNVNGTTFTSLTNAYNYLRRFRLYAVVTLQLAAVTNHNILPNSDFSHPDSKLIRINGNTASRDSYRINIDQISAGELGCINLEGSNYLYIFGCVIRSAYDTEDGERTYGIRASKGAYIYLSSVTVDGFSGSNICADEGGVIYGQNVLSINASVASLYSEYQMNEGNGFLAKRGGVMVMRSGIATDNNHRGFYAYQGGNMELYDCISEIHGYYARNKSIIKATRCLMKQINSSGPLDLCGFGAFLGSSIEAIDCSVLGLNPGGVITFGYLITSGSVLGAYGTSSSVLTGKTRASWVGTGFLIDSHSTMDMQDIDVQNAAKGVDVTEHSYAGGATGSISGNSTTPKTPTSLTNDTTTLSRMG